jgi:hypothetical protein
MKRKRKTILIGAAVAVLLAVLALALSQPSIEGFWCYGPAPLDGGQHYIEFKGGEIFEYAHEIGAEDKEQILRSLKRSKRSLGQYTQSRGRIHGWMDGDDNGTLTFVIYRIYPWRRFHIDAYYPKLNEAHRFFFIKTNNPFKEGAE